MKKVWLAVFALMLSPVVSAHTIALGTVNAGSAGSVVLWLGSYHSPSEGSPNEGSMTLNGVTQAFNVVSTTMPAGLIAGANLFYSQATCCVHAAGVFDQLTNGTGLPLRRWQGVTFTGLAAGTYSYTISGMNTAVWRDWNSNLNNWTGTLVIPRSSVAPTPEPGTLALLGLGLLGIGMARRRRSA